jgi:hypothetical protein
MAAAASPKITCRIPEKSKLLPVKSVIDPPIKKSPAALKMELNKTLFHRI